MAKVVIFNDFNERERNRPKRGEANSAPSKSATALMCVAHCPIDYLIF